MEGTEPTKQRLLEAAGQEFAERGFEGATIRSICDRAGANLAAVNYHFGCKEALYERALLEAHRNGPRPLTAEEVRERSPEEQLELYVRRFLEQVVGVNDGESWQRALMIREMTRPSAASATLARELIRPRFDALRGILGRLEPEAGEDRLNALSFSLVGQCLFYRLVGSTAEHLVGSAAYGHLDVEYLTRHITGLILAAIRAGESAPAGWADTRWEDPR